MAQAGYTPLSLYYSTTPSAAPLAANLVAGELALNTNDGKLYYKNSAGVVSLLASSNTAATAGTSILKGDGTGGFSNAVSGTDYAPATSGTSILYGNGAGGFSNVTIGSNLAFVGGTLSATAGGVLSFSAGTTGLTPSTATTGAITLAGTLATTNGGTGLTSFTANRVFYASSTSAIGSSANLTFDGSSLTVNSVRVGRGAGSVSTNTSVGQSCLIANTTGGNNTAFGSNSLQTNTTGNYNTAVGAGSLGFCSTSSYNTAVGFGALYNNGAGENNTAVGYGASQTNAAGQYNTSIGAGASFTNTNANNIVAVGYNALSLNTSNNNSAVGSSAGVGNTTGSNNTFVGQSAGSTNSTGSNNTFIGYNSSGATATTSNNITLGDSSITALRCQVTTITALSDERDKTNIKDIPAGLNFIEKLRPVSFDWNTRDGAKVGIPEFGFIAQELQKAQKNTGIKVPNLVFEENPEKLEAGMGALLPVLVKAIQELNEKVKLLESKL